MRLPRRRVRRGGAGMGKGNGGSGILLQLRVTIRSCQSGSRLATDNMLCGVLADLFLTCLRLFLHETGDDSASRRAVQQQRVADHFRGCTPLAGLKVPARGPRHRIALQCSPGASVLLRLGAALRVLGYASSSTKWKRITLGASIISSK